MGENSFASNSFTDRNFKFFFFYWWIRNLAVHSSRKICFCISKTTVYLVDRAKTKSRGRENLILIARYKKFIWFLISLEINKKTIRQHYTFFTFYKRISLF
jgi:hypothetical protein